MDSELFGLLYVKLSEYIKGRIWKIYMARSKHTRPERIIAADRVRAPRAARGKDNPSDLRQVARVLKEAGINLDLQNDPPPGAIVLPRITTRRPRQGFLHPAEKVDILRVLHFFGERCFYGLKSIKLIQGSSASSEAKLSMGRLEVPGTIVLYDQPVSTWFINGTLPKTEREKLEQAGASIEPASDNLHCLIHWSEANLRNFMLFEVFMHEIGHHLIQQYKGKRSVRVARTKDHEQFAALFAQRCRESFIAQCSGAADV